MSIWGQSRDRDVDSISSGGHTFSIAKFRGRNVCLAVNLSLRNLVCSLGRGQCIGLLSFSVAAMAGIYSDCSTREINNNC